MKQNIIEAVGSFVAEYKAQEKITTAWGTPLVGFAAADDPLFHKLKELVASTHALPRDLLPPAQTVISFFLPFPRSITSQNSKERLSTPQWALSYIETNELIKQLSLHMTDFFAAQGEKAAAVPATHNWIEDKLVSNWSHRHAAYIAGLGRFGLNNMLITKEGCSGRIGTLVTSAVLEPDNRPETEACLYKHNGSCKKCVRKCVNEALVEDSFDRFKCYAQLLENIEEHRNLGYADVCGKCLAAVPCSHADPVELTAARKQAK